MRMSRESWNAVEGRTSNSSVGLIRQRKKLGSFNRFRGDFCGDFKYILYNIIITIDKMLNNFIKYSKFSNKGR